MSSNDLDDHNSEFSRAPGQPGSGVFRLTAVFAAMCIAAMGGLWLFGTFDHEEPSELALFIGRFHPLIVHLPIGGLVLVFTLEVLSLLTARKWKPRTLGPLAFTAVTSVAAVACGYLLGAETSEAELLWHFRWALIFTALVLLTLVLRVVSARGGAGAGLLSVITMLGCVAAMSIAGHLGATITHGPRYVTQYAPASIKPSLEKLLGLEPRETTPAPAPAPKVLARPMMMMSARRVGRMMTALAIMIKTTMPSTRQSCPHHSHSVICMLISFSRFWSASVAGVMAKDASVQGFE